MNTVWKPTDYAGLFLECIVFNGEKLPKHLPWIEPSINCLHMESVNSFLVGNYECAIISMCALLEHTLRLAIINKDKCGLTRPETIAQIDKFNNLTKIVDVAVSNTVFNGCNEAWWRAVSKNIRNKSAHYLLPTILRNCATDSNLKQYIPKCNLPENNDSSYFERYITDWGAFYHSSGHFFAERFLRDATEQLLIIISNTNWKGDTSWWISEKNEYESFFSYRWTVENIRESFEKACCTFGGKK